MVREVTLYDWHISRTHTRNSAQLYRSAHTSSTSHQACSPRDCRPWILTDCESWLALGVSLEVKVANVLAQVYKLFIVVELLMGDIPERSVFRQPVLKKALVPYLQIVQGKYILLAY